MHLNADAVAAEEEKWIPENSRFPLLLIRRVHERVGEYMGGILGWLPPAGSCFGLSDACAKEWGEVQGSELHANSVNSGDEVVIVIA